jgi:threonine dehydrogenase-like Zn-dependent dehydrogenase
MRAVAVFPTTRRIAVVDDQPVPALTAPTEARVRLLDVGVCGTDREIARFEYGTPPPGASRLVLGHESLGEVVEVGPGVTGLKPGELVVTMVRRPCPHAHCRPCRAGRQDFCVTGDFTERGIRGRDGFMTEQIVDDARYLIPLPRALRHVGVLVEPLTIAEKALIQLWQVQQRLPWACPVEPGKAPGACHTALVLGAGPVGLLGALALRAADFDVHVFSRDRAPNPASQLLDAVGAHYVSSADETVEALAARLDGVDVVYEATGASGIAFETLQTLGPNAVFVFTGVPGRRGPIQLDADRLMRNMVLQNQMVFGTVNAGRDAFEAAIRDLGVFETRWPGVVGRLVTGRFPIAQAPELLTGAPAGGIKSVIAVAE